MNFIQMHFLTCLRLFSGSFTRVGRAAVAGLLLVAVGCSSTARRDETVATPLKISDMQIRDGQRVFMMHCNQCHVGGAGGVGPAINDKPLPEWAIRYQVRHGLGPMPAFSRRVISDDQLEGVIRYLKAKRDLKVEMAVR